MINFDIKVPPQMGNESHKNLQCEGAASEPEQKDPVESLQSEQPRALSECPR